MQIICSICKKEFDLPSFRRHLRKEHEGLSAKEYYDKYIKKDKEGLCRLPGCNNPTSFYGFPQGYAIGCCSSHAQRTQEVKDIVKKSYRDKYGVDFYNNRDKARETCLIKYGVDNVSKSGEVADKKIKRNMENRGVPYPTQSKTVLEKTKATNIEKYGEEWSIVSKNNTEKRAETFKNKFGVDNVIKSKMFRDLMENKGLWLPEAALSKRSSYRLAVMRETKKWVEKLFDTWDGRCYYTGELLVPTEEWNKQNKGHPSGNKLQPTVDHKISVNFGLTHNIDPKIIGNINNLCICSRSINSIKKTHGEHVTKRFGLDYHGCADTHAKVFAPLTHILVMSGWQVHIITGVEITEEFKSSLSLLGIRYTHLFSITDFHRSIGTAVVDGEKGPYIDPVLWDKTKAEYCKRMGIDMHIDDSGVYGKYFERTIYLQLIKPGKNPGIKLESPISEKTIE